MIRLIRDRYAVVERIVISFDMNKINAVALSNRDKGGSWAKFSHISSSCFGVKADINILHRGVMAAIKLYNCPNSAQEAASIAILHVDVIACVKPDSALAAIGVDKINIMHAYICTLCLANSVEGIIEQHKLKELYRAVVIYEYCRIY